MLCLLKSVIQSATDRFIEVFFFINQIYSNRVRIINTFSLYKDCL